MNEEGMTMAEGLKDRRSTSNDEVRYYMTQEIISVSSKATTTEAAQTMFDTSNSIEHCNTNTKMASIASHFRFPVSPFPRLARGCIGLYVLGNEATCRHARLSLSLPQDGHFFFITPIL